MRRLAYAVIASVALAGIVACDGIVDPDPGDPVDLTFALCAGAPDTPTWFAFQDGNGPWTRVNPTGSNAFNFTISSGRGGIAMYTPGYGLRIRYATTAEMQANFPACAGSVRGVGGSVTGYLTAETVRIAMGFSPTTSFPGTQAAPASFTLDAVDADVTDLVAVRYRSTSGASSFEAFPTNVFHRRDFTGTSIDIDFGSTSEAGPPVQRTVSVTNLVSGEALYVDSYLATRTTFAQIAQYFADAAAVSGSVIAPFYGIPATRLGTGESQAIEVVAEREVGSTLEARVATAVYTDPSDRSVTFGPALASVTVAGSSRPSATYTVQAAYDNLYEAQFVQGNGSSFRGVDIVATQGYLGAVSSVTLAVPDLSGASGFLSTWLLVPGQPSRWAFFASDADLSLLNDKPLVYVGGYREANFTP